MLMRNLARQSEIVANTLLFSTLRLFIRRVASKIANPKTTATTPLMKN